MSKNKMESEAKNMAAMNDSHSDFFGCFFFFFLRLDFLSIDL